ncbi:multicopper oxidase [Elysia marginata]|uniref:Multicopper oxidase n=1 Tax=Elysia marginata TaxID=1093978 RepID=A0AAV4ERK7_9GAST|nr:multicopper oxidase [Elysia marginata]
MRTHSLNVLACAGLIAMLPHFVRTNMSDDIYDVDDYKNHPCNRACEDNSPPRLCQYKWVVESYWTLPKACLNCPFNQSDCFRPHCISADGVQRGVSVVNRRLPGPPIEVVYWLNKGQNSMCVCQGDTIEVKIYNELSNGEGTSIHWHGLLQKGTPHMDGVSLVTQCPITYRSSFTYRFKAVDAGTHYWHGHTGMQRADGLLGAIVVRQPRSREPHFFLYDHDLSEHVILVNDWLTRMTLTAFLDHHHDDGDNKPALMLINGMGAHREFMDGNSTIYTPRASFTVQGGKKYRFRVISGAILNCPIQISVDGHTMLMIASDGNAFEPFTADSFNIFAGERYDFVLYADKTNALRNYWIRARGMADCSVKKAHQVAVLRYAGAPDVDPPEPTDWDSSIRGGMLLNPWNTPGSSTQVEITRMRASIPDENDGVLTSMPDKKFYLGMDFNKVDNFKFNNPNYYPLSFVERKKELYSPQINHISSMRPPSPPLSQFDDVPMSARCQDNVTGSAVRKRSINHSMAARFQLSPAPFLIEPRI